MHHGWIATYGSREQMTVQISVATHGGSKTPTPDYSQSAARCRSGADEKFLALTATS
jgi:hypothetical protein